MRSIFIKIIWIVFLFLIFSCNQKSNEMHDFDSMQKTSSGRLKLVFRTIAAYNIISTDSSIVSSFSKDATFLHNGIIYLNSISNEASLWLVPIEELLLKYYVLVIIEGDCVISFKKIDAAWIDNDESGYVDNLRLLSPPYIFKEDINKDCIQELIIKDRQHIGNVYNAAVEHFFSLRRMHIKDIGVYEYISYLAVEDEFLVRHWNKNTNIVNVFVKKKLQSSDSCLVGSFEMKVYDDTIYQCNMNIINSDFKDLLISTKEE